MTTNLQPNLKPVPSVPISPELTIKLLELYKNFPCLWQIEHLDNNNRLKKDKAHRALLQLIKIEVPDANINFVKAKIKNLRTAFRKEYRKMQAFEKSGEGNVYQPKLYYFDTLKFIVQQPRAKSIQTQISSPSTPSNVESTSQSSVDSKGNKEDADVIELNPEELQDPLPSTSSSTPTLPQKKKKRKNSKSNELKTCSMEGYDTSFNDASDKLVNNALEQFHENELNVSQNNAPDDSCKSTTDHPYVNDADVLSKNAPDISSNETSNLTKIADLCKDVSDQTPRNSAANITCGSNVANFQNNQLDKIPRNKATNLKCNCNATNFQKNQLGKISRNNVTNISGNNVTDLQKNVLDERSCDGARNLPGNNAPDITRNEEDECIAFGNLVGVKLKSMSRDQRLLAEQHINTILLRGKLDLLSPTTVPASPNMQTEHFPVLPAGVERAFTGSPRFYSYTHQPAAIGNRKFTMVRSNNMPQNSDHNKSLP